MVFITLVYSVMACFDQSPISSGRYDNKTRGGGFDGT